MSQGHAVVPLRHSGRKHEVAGAHSDLLGELLRRKLVLDVKARLSDRETMGRVVDLVVPPIMLFVEVEVGLPEIEAGLANFDLDDPVSLESGAFSPGDGSVSKRCLRHGQVHDVFRLDVVQHDAGSNGLLLDVDRVLGSQGLLGDMPAKHHGAVACPREVALVGEYFAEVDEAIVPPIRGANIHAIVVDNLGALQRLRDARQDVEYALSDDRARDQGALRDDHPGQ